MSYRITKNEIIELLEIWSKDHEVFVPSKDGWIERYTKGLEIDFTRVPVYNGIKEFVFPARNRVTGDLEKVPIKILVGVRSCDIRALKGALDKIFLEEEPVDTVYENFRKNIRLVSVDCSAPADTCFCESVGGSVFNKDGFDVNLSFVDDDIALIESGSAEGESLLSVSAFAEAADAEISKKNDLEDTAKRTVRSNFNLDYENDAFSDRVRKNVKEEYWSKKSETCMQCGGCNFVCPTCYCNVLNELSTKKEFIKILQWDSCHFPGYARVAGGANPRENLWQRFRHRYFCKFIMMLKEFSIPGCTGCGRCIQTCPGKIDIRETLRGLK